MNGTVQKNDGLWFKEWLTPHATREHKLKKILLRKKTPFQNALVADFHSLGRCLVLDGEIQSAGLDEFIYHEALIHPAMTLHSGPRRVAVLGGGEGATLREILKHRGLEKAVMVDIDGEVVRLCEKHLPAWHGGAFQNPRTEVVIGDAKAFIEESAGKFDVIVSDLPSPLGGGPADGLYTVEFYRILKTRLNAGGVFVAQAGSGNLLEIGPHLRLYRTLREVFPLVRPYYAYVPSFDVPWAYLFCGLNGSADPLDVTGREIEKRIAQRVRGRLQFYDGTTHEGLFRVPKYLREKLRAEKECIRAKKP